MVDGAGHRYRHTILSEHGHMSGAMRVQVWSDVVVAGIISVVRADFCSHFIRKMLLNDLNCLLFKPHRTSRMMN